jgi:AraC-type DNA-binding domain-containing proteins
MNRGSEIPLQTLVIPDDIRLRPMLHYIIEHAQEDLTIEHVARQFGFSVRNLSRLLQGSGIRFTNYLNYQRITRAIELFADGDKTMQQIAYEVGFSTPNNFNRVFKQMMGVNPSVFCKKK